MPQPRKARRFGGSPAHHQMMMANLATELFRHGRIRTTQAKAKTVQPLAEKMITFAKRGDVSARREVLKVVRDRDVVHKLFADIGPAFSERNGGYTRVLKLGNRKGDNAPMALIELVEGVTGDREGTLQEAPRRRWSLRRRAGTLSTTARESAEERAAAADRGEQPQYLEEEEPEAADAVPAGALEEDEDGPQVRPEDVEARLAAEDEDAEDAEPEASAESSDESDEDDEEQS